MSSRGGWEKWGTHYSATGRAQERASCVPGRLPANVGPPSEGTYGRLGPVVRQVKQGRWEVCVLCVCASYLPTLGCELRISSHTHARGACGGGGQGTCIRQKPSLSILCSYSADTHTTATPTTTTTPLTAGTETGCRQGRGDTREQTLSLRLRSRRGRRALPAPARARLVIRRLSRGRGGWGGRLLRGLLHRHPYPTHPPRALGCWGPGAASSSARGCVGGSEGGGRGVRSTQGPNDGGGGARNAPCGPTATQ